MFNEQFNRKEFAENLAKELRVLRASANVSQSDVAWAIGISRQTYCAYENQAKEIPWSRCLALVFYFESMPEAMKQMKAVSLIPDME